MNVKSDNRGIWLSPADDPGVGAVSNSSTMTKKQKNKETQKEEKTQTERKQKKKLNLGYLPNFELLRKITIFVSRLWFHLRIEHLLTLEPNDTNEFAKLLLILNIK